MCVVIECKTKNAEAMDITDATHSLFIISEQLMQQYTADHLKTCEPTVPILMLTSAVVVSNELHLLRYIYLSKFFWVTNTFRVYLKMGTFALTRVHF